MDEHNPETSASGTAEESKHTEGRSGFFFSPSTETTSSGHYFALFMFVASCIEFPPFGIFFFTACDCGRSSRFDFLQIYLAFVGSGFVQTVLEWKPSQWKSFVLHLWKKSFGTFLTSVLNTKTVEKNQRCCGIFVHIDKLFKY